MNCLSKVVFFFLTLSQQVPAVRAGAVLPAEAAGDGALLPQLRHLAGQVQGLEGDGRTLAAALCNIYFVFVTSVRQ